MNCWILLVLLFCNGSFARTGSGRCVTSDCDNNENRREDRNCGCTDRDRRESERSCGCSDRRDATREGDCGCRMDARTESRFDARPFISYSGNTCGCEDARNNNDCNCCQ